MSMNKRPFYLPPMARDLSGGMAVGDDQPMGVCIVGPTPYYNCLNGTQFVGSCAPGTGPDTSACGPGGYHTTPACSTGAVAATICLSGQGQQWT